LLFASAATLPFLRDGDTFAAAVTLIFTPRGRFRTRTTQTPLEASPTTMRR